MENIITVRPQMLKGEVSLPKSKNNAQLGAYFLVAGAIGNKIICNNLNGESSSEIIDIIKMAGGEIIYTDSGISAKMTGNMKGISADLKGREDILIPVALLCAFLKGESRISVNISPQNEVLRGIADEFKHLGIYAEMTSSGLYINGGQTILSDGAYAWNNSEIAMALILASSRAEGEVRVFGFDQNVPKFKTFMKLYKNLSGEK